MARSRQGAKSLTRRVGGVILVVLLFILLGVVALVSTVLFVPAATRAVLSRAVAGYAGRVAGDVRVGDIEGALARGARLYGVRLEDGRGQPVVAARMLRIRLRPWPLLIGRVGLEVSLEDTAVHLWPEGGFADLVPERDEPPPDDEIGPDLPLRIVADLELRNVDITSHAPDGTQTLVADDLRLSGEVRARGRQASVEIDSMSGRLFDAVTVEALTARARWSAPQLDLEQLAVSTDAGDVNHAQGSWNVETDELEADVTARLDTRAVLDEPPALLAEAESIELRARAGGRRDDLWTFIEASAGPNLRSRIAAVGAISPRPAAVLDVLVEAQLDEENPLRLHAHGAVEQHEAGARGTVLVVCTSCPEPITLSLRGVMADEQWWMRARSWVPGTEIRGHARGAGGALALASLDLELDDVAPLRRALAPWVDLPELDARAMARVRCRGERLDHCRFSADATRLVTPAITARRMVASGEVRLEQEERVGQVALELRDIRRESTRIGDLEVDARGTLDAIELNARLDGAHEIGAELDMVVRPGERTRIDLRAFDAAWRELRATLLDPARLEIGDEEIEVEALRLRVGSGVVGLEGLLSTRGTSDLRLVARELVLEQLAAVAPGPDLRGVVNATLSLAGSLEAPIASANIEARALAIEGVAVGRLTARLGYRANTLVADVQARDGVARSAKIELRAPLVANLRAGRVHLPARRHVQLDADVRELALSRLSPAAAGRIDAGLSVRGPLSEPVLSGHLRGQALTFERGRIGDARVRVSYDDERAELRAELRGPLARRLNAAASLPVTVDLARPAIDLHEHRELRLAVTAEHADLEAPSNWVENWPLGGFADTTLRGQGSVSDWHAHLVARGHAIAYAGREIGDALVDVATTPSGTDLDLRLTGPVARKLHVRGRVPLSIDAKRLEPTWERHETHEIDALVDHVDLSYLGRVGLNVPVSGHVDGLVHIEGSVDDASGVVDLSTSRLAWRGRRLGRVWLAARYDGERLVALAEQQSGRGEWIRGRFEAPIHLVDAAPYLDWQSGADHRFSLQAAGLDEHLVGAFVTIPPATRLDASARLMGSGSIDDFRLDGRVRGSFGRGSLVGTNFFADLNVRNDEQELRAFLGANGIETLNLVARTRAPLIALARGEAEAADVAIDAKMDADQFPLEAFEPLLPTALDGLRGSLQVRAFGSGTLGAPDLQGFVEIQDGSVTVVPMVQRLENADVFVLFDGSRIRLDELRVRSGRGTTLARGQVFVGREQTRGHLYLQAEGLPIVRPGLPIMTLDTRIVTTFDARAERTDIEVTAEDVNLRVLATNVDAPASIPQSRDVVIVGERPTPEPEPTAPTAPGEPAGDLRLRFRLDRPALVGGPNADMEWNGALEVTRTDGITRVEGALEATRGRILVLDHEFQIERGFITLPAEEVVDPFIDLVATTDLPDATVTIAIRGRASRPDLRLTSSPTMTETEVFSLLVTGSPGAAREEGTEFDAQAAAMLAVFNNPTIAGHIRETIGIDRVGVAFGEDIENPIVTIGKRLTRRIYLETRYHHDAPPNTNTAEVRLEYTFIPPRWSLQTHFGDAAVGGVEVWWHKRFGGGRGGRQPLGEPPAPRQPGGPEG